MKKRRTRPLAQPKPNVPGITRRMVRMHARRLYRDVYSQRPLAEHEWRLVEEDLARKLERDGL